MDELEEAKAEIAEERVIRLHGTNFTIMIGAPPDSTIDDDELIRIAMLAHAAWTES